MNSNFTKIVRNLLGAILIVFGANMFLHFLPLTHYMDPLQDKGYIFPIVGFLEVVIGVLLLMRKWTAFTLIVLAPISVNILLFHLFSNVPGIPIAMVVMMCNIMLIVKYWPQYRPLFY